MATILELQDQINLKAEQIADNKLKSLSDDYKALLLNNIDPASYADKEVFKGLKVVKLFDPGSPAYDKIRKFYYIQEVNRLTLLAISRLS